MFATIATRSPSRPHPAADPTDRGRAWLARLFAGDFAFPTITPAPLPPAARPAAESDALGRAAGCRDLFVVHADPAAGERFIAELVCAGPGRALVLTPDSAAADRVAERLLKAGAGVIRALADDENPTRPSAVVSAATSAALGVGAAEAARRAAVAALTAAEQRMAAFAVVSKAVARLVEVTESLARLDAAAAARAAALDSVTAAVAEEAAGRAPGTLADRLAALRAAHDAQLAGLTEACDAARRLADDKGAEVANLRLQHTAAATKSGFFGRLFSKPKAGCDADDLKKLLDAAEAELAALAAAAAAKQADLDAKSAALAADREKAVADELAARRAVAEAALAESEGERARARAEAAALNKVITAAVPNDDHAAAARELAAARDRAAEAGRAAPDILARATADLRAVVGTPGCLADPLFAAFAADPPFDLLVLDRAEELPETEFPRLARLAERWVLVGDAAPRDDFRPANGRPPRPGRGAETFVSRVARLLDRETWAAEGDRLVCRLVHLSAEQRRHLTREPLADRPEIELRFSAAEEPLLAEIAFPGATTVPDAKNFLFHTLNEVLLRPCGEAAWSHAPDAITATFPAADGPGGAWVELEPGVREKVCGFGLFAYTAAVSFDPHAGWDADRAAAWLALRMPPPPIGRFAALPRSR
jgi:hypothetical protein